MTLFWYKSMGVNKTSDHIILASNKISWEVSFEIIFPMLQSFFTMNNYVIMLLLHVHVRVRQVPSGIH